MIGDPLQTLQGAYRHLVVEETVSTNTLCLDYASAGEQGGLWITANRQTGGKGSRGRHWESQNGNLFASLLLTNPSDKTRLADLTFIAAISVLEAIQIYSHKQNDIKVKWPNDVMLNGRKCSGILLESIHHQDEINVVIGIGVNCQQFPHTALHASTSLFAEGIEVPANNLFLTLASKMADNIALWQKGNNFSAIRQKWLDHAYGMGKALTVHVPNREPLEGVFVSLDEDGYMLLETSNGSVEQISTADIFFNTTKNGQ